MSKTKSNVHAAHYRVAGRESLGEDVVHDREKTAACERPALLAPRYSSKLPNQPRLGDNPRTRT